MWNYWDKYCFTARLISSPFFLYVFQRPLANSQVLGQYSLVYSQYGWRIVWESFPIRSFLTQTYKAEKRVGEGRVGRDREQWTEYHKHWKRKNKWWPMRLKDIFIIMFMIIEKGIIVCILKASSKCTDRHWLILTVKRLLQYATSQKLSDLTNADLTCSMTENRRWQTLTWTCLLTSICLLGQCELAIYCQWYHNREEPLSEKTTESAD